jgi:hypothetical protein
MFHRTRGLIVTAGSGALLAGAMAGVAPAQAAKDWRLRTAVVPDDPNCAIPGPDRVLRKLGPVNVLAGSPGAQTKYRDFRRAVGRPKGVAKIPGGQGITASYPGGPAGTFAFISFGAVERRGQLQLQYATLTGRRWVTEKGVRVGNRLAKIKKRYRQQAWRIDGPQRPGNWWRLAGHCGHPLVTQEITVIEAKIKRGRVKAFYVWVGAAGD